MSKLKLSKKEVEKILNDDDYMTDRQKLIFKFYYVKGWIAEKIGGEINRSEITVYRELAKIKENISKILNDR